MRNIILLFVLLLQNSCVQGQQEKKMNREEALFKQYAFLLEKSIKFDFANDSFKYVVQTYIDTCTEYNAQSEMRTSPFRNTPIQLKPYLLNNAEDEVIIMVLVREKDLKNAPIDYVHFIFGKRTNKKWTFRLKERYVRSFSYEGGHPLLSDVEMSLRILRTLIDVGYMPLNELKINDKFFEKDTW